ncbi:MAG: hypothetical protein KAI43_06195 [Candidatus Aureabacteria bacterium]|nr:hypothetical protein [Candidatus Auribacterota bacterium]
MKNRLKNLVLGAVIAFLLLIIIPTMSYVGYLTFTYIDDTVITGEKYGFKIGESKEVVFQKARELYKDQTVYVLHPLDQNNHGPHKQIGFNEKEYPLLSERDEWRIYYDEKYFNSIRLKFKEGKLVEIHRHRKYFELP